MYIFDVNTKNFQQVVLEGSAKVPVLVDFWAHWCGPCLALKPILEKLAEQYQGKFMLAKINSDENQALATQYGVRSIPNVKVFFRGNIVNEFSGALPENAVRKFIDSILPTEADGLVADAGQAIADKQYQRTRLLLDQALVLDPEHIAAKLLLIELHLENQAVVDARNLFEQLPDSIKLEKAVSTLHTRLVLAELTQNLPAEAELKRLISATPGNLQARLDLANVYISQRNYSEALELLFEVLQINKNFADGAARKTLLSLFTLLEDQPEIVRPARRRLALLLN